MEVTSVNLRDSPVAVWAHRPTLTRKVHLPETMRSKQSYDEDGEGEEEYSIISGEFTCREAHEVKTYIGLTKYIDERTKHFAVRLSGCIIQNAS